MTTISITVSDEITHWFFYKDDRVVQETVIYRKSEDVWILNSLIDWSKSGSQN